MAPPNASPSSTVKTCRGMESLLPIRHSVDYHVSRPFRAQLGQHFMSTLRPSSAVQLRLSDSLRRVGYSPSPPAGRAVESIGLFPGGH